MTEFVQHRYGEETTAPTHLKDAEFKPTIDALQAVLTTFRLYMSLDHSEKNGFYLLKKDPSGNRELVAISPDIPPQYQPIADYMLYIDANGTNDAYTPEHTLKNLVFEKLSHDYFPDFLRIYNDVYKNRFAEFFEQAIQEAGASSQEPDDEFIKRRYERAVEEIFQAAYIKEFSTLADTLIYEYRQIYGI